MLKLDIEGGERALFREGVLGNVHAVFVELHDRIEGCSNAFHDFARDKVCWRFGGEKHLAVRQRPASGVADH